MRRRLARPVAILVAIAAVSLAACSSESTEPSATTSAPGATAGATVVGGATSSALDLLDADARDGLSDSEAALVGLLIAPVAAGEFRLIQYEVQDPNGNGKIGERWYRPELVHSTCNVRVDSPTTPVAVAVYLPGDPSDLSLLDSPLDSVQARMEAPMVLSVQVNVFDTAEQRDGYADAAEELMAFVNDPCAKNAADVSTPGPAEFEPPDVGYPGVGFSGRMMIGESTTMYYRVGDRVLLTVSIGQLMSAKGDAPTVEDATAALNASIALLQAAGLG